MVLMRVGVGEVIERWMGGGCIREGDWVLKGNARRAGIGLHGGFRFGLAPLAGDAVAGDAERHGMLAVVQCHSAI